MSYDKWSLLCIGPFAAEHFEWVDCHLLRYDEETSVGLFTDLLSSHNMLLLSSSGRIGDFVPSECVHLLSNQTGSDK